MSIIFSRHRARPLMQIGVALGTALCAAVVACRARSSTAQAAWTNVLSRCTANAALTKNVLYFGPSNGVGVGAVWHKRQGSGYQPVWDLSDAVSDTTTIKTLLAPSHSATCDGTNTTLAKARAAALLSSSALPVSAGFATDMSRASSVAAGVRTWTWDVIKEGPYMQMVGGLNPASGYGRDLKKANYFVATKALRVEGFKADLVFSKALADSLRVKYTGKLKFAGLDTAEAVLSASWEDNGTLHLVSAEPFIIAVELSKYTTGGFAGGKGKLVATSIGNGAMVEPPSRSGH